MKRDSMSLDSVEALIMRLFAEKQFAVAMMAMLFVAYLATAQFMLLRMSVSMAQTTSAPNLDNRVDLSCDGAVPRALDGHAAPLSTLVGKRVVLHMPETQNQCVTALTNAHVSEVVVGVPVGAEVSSP